MEFLIGHHIEIARTGEAEDDGLLFSGFLAPDCFVNGDADRVGAFRRGQDAFYFCEVLRGFKHFRLLDADCFQQALVIELGQGGTHAVIAQAAGVVGGRDKIAAQRIHLGKRADHTRIAEIVSVYAAGQAGAGSGFNGDDLVVGFAAELFSHKRCDQAAQIGSAAGTANDNVGFYAVFIQGGFGL